MLLIFGSGFGYKLAKSYISQFSCGLPKTSLFSYTLHQISLKLKHFVILGLKQA